MDGHQRFKKKIKQYGHMENEIIEKKIAIEMRLAYSE